MLGRKNYTRKEYDDGRSVIANQLAVYKKLASAIASDPTDKKLESTLEAFEVPFFNNMTLVLDRYFVHRLRMTTGKDGNPINEVELLSDSLMNNGGELRENNVIKYVPGDSVLKLEPGDRIRLNAAQFERLSKAFFADLDAKFVK